MRLLVTLGFCLVCSAAMAEVPPPSPNDISRAQDDIGTWMYRQVVLLKAQVSADEQLIAELRKQIADSKADAAKSTPSKAVEPTKVDKPPK